MGIHFFALRTKLFLTMFQLRSFMDILLMHSMVYIQTMRAGVHEKEICMDVPQYSANGYFDSSFVRVFFKSFL